jgi:hypothetical protein
LLLLRTRPLASYVCALRRATLALAATLFLLTGLTAVANAAWHEPVGGPSPVNHLPDRSAYTPDVTEIAGVPYVAWSEMDELGTHAQIRVSRLNSAGTAWEEVVGGRNPINHSIGTNADDPSLIGIDGVPYVAWSEAGGWPGYPYDYHIRVSRLNAAGTAWEELGGSVNHANYAVRPSLTEVAGEPYVAWSEWDNDHQENNLRVSRLNAAGTAWEEVGGPIDRAGESASDPSLTAIDGVPYVAIGGSADGVSAIRVRRLSSSGTAWEDVGDPMLPRSDRFPGQPSLTAIDGVPYVAWTEENSFEGRLRVSRLNAAGTAWAPVVGGENPLNQAPDSRGVGHPSLTATGGMPYVAWFDYAGSGIELRVSRLSASGTAWEDVAGGPINTSTKPNQSNPRLTTLGGVPYVAWGEGGPDAGASQIRVSRLEPDFLSQAALATNDDALLLTRVRTYGVAYPIAFQYGRGEALDHQTGATPTAYGQDVDTIFQTIGGLTPGSDYSWRSIGFDGVRASGAGPTDSFTTLAVPDLAVPGPPGPPGPKGDPGASLLVAVLNPHLRGVVGRSVAVRYVLTGPADVKLEVRRCGGKLVATVRDRSLRGAPAKAGRGTLRWDGRIAGRRPGPGCYSLAIKAAGADGQTASDRAKLRLTRRAVVR